MSEGRGENGAADVWIGDLYRRHSDWLRRRLRRRFGDDGEDFAQEAWRRLIARYGEAGIVRHPRALLLKIAVNTGLDAVRRASPPAPVSEAVPWRPGGQEAQETAVLLEQIILGLPESLREVGVTDRFDVEQNLSGGADYLARQLLRFGDLKLALAAYNAGPGRVARLGRVPDIQETRNYVASVIDCYLALTAGRGVRSAPQCRAREPVW